MKEDLETTARFFNDTLGEAPEIAVVLGSGLGALTEDLLARKSIPYGEIPHFPHSSAQGVSGHAGRCSVGNGKGHSRVCYLEGRPHYYQGYTMREVAYPIYALKVWGVKTVILTNAAGGVNRDFSPGDLMLIIDHINLMGDNPLIGPHHDFLGPRFPDLSQPYSPRLLEMARAVAKRLSLPYREGVYAGWAGPAYETAAEIRFIEKIGADAVGMSTVPEVIAAVHAGMEVLAISCITNMATGIASTPHSHEQVVAMARQSSDRLCRWLEEILSAMSTT